MIINVYIFVINRGKKEIIWFGFKKYNENAILNLFTHLVLKLISQNLEGEKKGRGGADKAIQLQVF